MSLDKGVSHRDSLAKYAAAFFKMSRSIRVLASSAFRRAISNNMAPVRIGCRTIVSQRAFLCAGTHDYLHPEFQLVTKPITIAPYCWVAAEAFVGPGVTMNEGAVLGARGVPFSDLEAWTVYAGNPVHSLKNVVQWRLKNDSHYLNNYDLSQ
jgi:acetyltransferase-like isoleucine patch superfamily enzyme